MVDRRARFPARLPPRGLPDFEPNWSRLVDVATVDGAVTWHVLDNGVSNPATTLLCVHGNPTWSYLWRELLATAPPDVRVVAVDQLDMGYSERTGVQRRLRDRIDDLDALSVQLDLGKRIVTAGHDWGGPVSLGWALRNRNRLEGIVLANTAVAQPKATAGARLLQLVRARLPRELLTVRTPAFLAGTLGLSRPRPERAIRSAYLAPYGDAVLRYGISDFVEDIPFEPDHATTAALAAVASGLDSLGDLPVLLAWGGKDPVFNDVFLGDLQDRLPHAVTHRFANAGHLVVEDAPVASVVFDWLQAMSAPTAATPSAPERLRIWGRLVERSDDESTAVVELTGDEVRRTSFKELAASISSSAAGLADHGVGHGDRVALLVPPGVELATALHAVWRIGAVAVFVDAGLGAAGIRNALASAHPSFLIGNEKAVAAARLLGWPGERITVEDPAPGRGALLGASTSLAAMRRGTDSSPSLATPGPDDVAAVAFTSGATGPAKGVVYRHRQLEAQRDALVRLYAISPDDRLVAAFAPFALFGPTMGITSVVPDMDITSPATLTARALAHAVQAIDATLVFASPAALRNVAATAAELEPDEIAALAGVRLCLSAGAPMPVSLLRQARDVMPNAEVHTPYGMTEVLPVADISLGELETTPAGDGVCVGHPIREVDVAIAALDELGRPASELTTEPGITGEVCIRAAHMRDGYDNLWATELAASQPSGWHRSGDAGRLDGSGRLWIEGRLAHLVTTAAGPVTPIALEHRIEALDDIRKAAVVGVGPPGAQVIVAIVEPVAAVSQPGLADFGLAQRIRAGLDHDIAAVLAVEGIPVDIRHNSKINRLALAAWADAVCRGERVKAP